jgi:hypothetical protein
LLNNEQPVCSIRRSHHCKSILPTVCNWLHANAGLLATTAIATRILTTAVIVDLVECLQRRNAVALILCLKLLTKGSSSLHAVRCAGHSHGCLRHGHRVAGARLG